MTTKANLVKLPNSALVMIPRVGKLTVIARKLYYVLLKDTAKEVIAMEKEGKEISGTHLFSIPLKESVHQILPPGDKSDPRTVAKKYLAEMRRIEVDWAAPDAHTGVVWRSMGLLSEAQIQIRNGVAWARWALPPTLLAAMLDPVQRKTFLDLDQNAFLDSYAALALFVICTRYRDNPTKLTSVKTSDWWTDVLTNTAPPVEKGTGVVLRREWRKFKSEVVTKAIKEINEKTDLVVELIEHKTLVGRDVQFRVERKRPSIAELPKISSELAELASNYDVGLDAIAKMVKEGHTEAEIRIALVKLGSRANVIDLPKIENRSLYLRKLLREAAFSIPKFQIVDSVGSPSGKSGDRADQSPVVITPEQERRNAAKKEFSELLPEIQQIWMNQAASRLEGVGMLTPNMARKVREGQWRSGVLLERAVVEFASTTIGEDWLVG